VPSRVCPGFRVLDALTVDDIGRAPAQAAHRLHRGFAVGEPPPAIAPTLSVVAQLDDPGHVKARG
jgi:hypothetical protein